MMKKIFKTILVLVFFIGITQAHSQVITGNTTPPLNQWITYTVSAPGYECEQIIGAVWEVFDSNQTSMSFPNDWDDCFEFYVYFESPGTYTISYDNLVVGAATTTYWAQLEVTVGSNTQHFRTDSSAATDESNIETSQELTLPEKP